METTRLDKLIANTGKYSRKEAKALIRSGRVLVGGVAATGGEQKIRPGERVTVDGAVLSTGVHRYVMLNKPAGVVCATRDNRDRTVIDLLPQELRSRDMFPAGRLDKDTEGFVLLTDDGELAHRMLSPRSHVPKTYRAVLDRPFDREAVAAAFAGGMAMDGEPLLPADLSVLEAGDNPLVELVLREGKYHQVKRMFRRFGLEVLHLRRVRIGGLDLDPALRPGEARELSQEELVRLLGGDGRTAPPQPGEAEGLELPLR